MLELLRQKGEPKNGLREKRSAVGLDCQQKKRSNLAEPTALPIFRPSAPMLAREAKAYVVCPEVSSISKAWSSSLPGRAGQQPSVVIVGQMHVLNYRSTSNCCQV